MTRATARPPAWPTTLTAVLLVWILVLPALVRPLRDPDLWWLAWAGRQALAGALPRSNLLSWTAPDHPWTLHEPLVAVVLGALGPERAWIARAAVLGGIAVALAHLVGRSRHGWAAVAALLWVAPALSLGLSERALAWGDLALLLTWCALPRRPALAGLVVVAWSLAHGSFVLGLGLLALRAPLAALLAAAAITAVHPAGPGIWALLADYGLGRGPPGLVPLFVTEWRPLDPTTAAGALQALTLGAAAWLVGRHGSWRERVLLAAGLFLSVRHRRYVDPAALLLLPAMVRLLAERLPRRPLGPLVALVLPGLLAALPLASGARPDPQRFPPELPGLVPRGARPWNDFELGGYLGWAGVPVFWDPRNDCYPEDVLLDGIAVMVRHPGWQERLARRGVDAVVTRDPAKVEALRSAGWRPAGRAADVSVLLRPEESAPGAR